MVNSQDQEMSSGQSRKLAAMGSLSPSYRHHSHTIQYHMFHYHYGVTARGRRLQGAQFYDVRLRNQRKGKTNIKHCKGAGLMIRTTHSSLGVWGQSCSGDLISDLLALYTSL